MEDQHLTFMQWLAQGGDYVIALAAIVTALTVLCAALVKAYKAWQKPAREAAEKSEQGDRELHERVDGLEGKHADYDEKLANDYASINLLKCELTRQAEASAMLTEGVYLIIQHLVTNDHVHDMETWMREHAKMASLSFERKDEAK